jgi:tetratricopeptide (TPR) repeat protein
MLKLRRNLSMLAVIGLVTAGVIPAMADQTYDEASAAFQGGDYEVAAEKFKELIDKTPSWGPGYVVLGQSYFMIGQPDLGDRTIARAGEVDVETDLFQAYLSAAKMLQKEKRFADAILPYERALANAEPPNRPSTAISLAYCCLTAGQSDRARETLEAYQEEFGADTTSAFYLALACKKLDDYPCALGSLRAADWSSAPESQAVKAREYLAKWSHHWALLPANKDRQKDLLIEAVGDTRPWFTADPSDPSAVRYHSETLLAAGLAHESIEELTPVAAADPANCAVQAAIAKAYNSRHEIKNAVTWATRAVECDSSNAEAHVQLAAANILQMQSEHNDLAQVQRDLARIRDAVAALEKAIEADPNHQRAGPLLADARKTLVDLQRAEKMFVERNAAYQQQVDAVERENIRERCRVILWKLDTESEILTPEEEAFNKEQRCKQYAAKQGG